MEQTKPFFSPEMCQKLSSLAPGFEGHWWYMNDTLYGEGIYIGCHEEERLVWDEKICPAWQVEDLLRNWDKIMPVAQGGNSVVDSQMNMMRHQFANRIVSEFLYNPDTAYQKIEEYLWTVLK